MLVCSECGVENQLGRVFCSGCGAKLDLSKMTHEDVSESQEIGWFRRFWWLFVVAFVVVVVGLVALALWPKAGVLEEAGVRTAGRRVQRMLSDMERSRPGRGASLSLSDNEINAYFKYMQKMPVTVSCKVMNDHVRVRIVRVLKKFDLKLFSYTPTVSHEMELVPVGSRLLPRRVWIGHLRLMGPFKTSVKRKVHGVFAAQKEWKALENVQKLKIEKGKLLVQYEGKK